jgi:DNA-binding CsgD family transcriptional regulator
MRGKVADRVIHGDKNPLRDLAGSAVAVRRALPTRAVPRDGECAQAMEAAHRIASRTGEALALLARSEIGYQRDSLRAALADAQQAARLFQAVGAVGLRAVAVAHSIRVFLMQGEPGSVAAEAMASVQEASGHPFVHGLQQEARGLLAAAQGNRSLALRLYLECGRHLMAGGLVNPACSAWRSRAVAVLAGLGRIAEARALAENEVRLARGWGAPGPLGRALVGYAVAHEAARGELLEEAVAVLEDSDCRLNLARALIRLGSHRYASGYGRAARDVLEQGLEIAAECGAATMVTAARRTMHAVGARPRGHPASATLTAAELRVAELVINGMSNQAVATALTLSKRTVDTHLGRIYRKLGITGRARLRDALTGTER